MTKAGELGRPEPIDPETIAQQVRAIAVREKRSVSEAEFLALLDGAQNSNATEARSA